MAGRTDANIRGNTTAFLNILAIGALAPTSASKCLSPNGGMVGLRPSCTNGCDLPHEVHPIAHGCRQELRLGITLWPLEPRAPGPATSKEELLMCKMRE